MKTIFENRNENLLMGLISLGITTITCCVFTGYDSPETTVLLLLFAVFSLAYEVVKFYGYIKPYLYKCKTFLKKN